MTPATHPAPVTIPKSGVAAPALPYVPALDGLRAIAVILVLLSHFPYVAGWHFHAFIWQYVQVLRTGYIGVDLFFVLSGFLISRLLIREKQLNGRIDIFAFYRRRAFRIFPIYYLALIVCLIMFPPSGGAVASLIFYVFNYYHPFHPAPYALEHTWSLCVEEQFYLLWPMIVMLMPLRWGRPFTLFVLPALALLSAAVLILSFEPVLAAELIYNSLFTRMLSLAFGAYLAFREAEGAPIPLSRCVLIISTGLAVLVWALLCRSAGWLPAGGTATALVLLGFAVLEAGTVALVLSNALRWLTSTFSWTWLRAIGRMSYGLYLYHLIILFALGINPASAAQGVSATAFFAALLLTFGIAALSFRFIERPLLAMRGRA